MNNDIKKCPSCGAVGVDSVEACQAQFVKVLNREFADPNYFKAHRLTVDAYCLQHPEQYMVSSKSAAAHLAGMCWSMERGYSLHLHSTLKKWVDGKRTYTRVAPPPQLSRGKLTINHVQNISDPEQYFRAVTEWAESAWKAWSPHWPQARKWVKEAVSESNQLD